MIQREGKKKPPIHNGFYCLKRIFSCYLAEPSVSCRLPKIAYQVHIYSNRFCFCSHLNLIQYSNDLLLESRFINTPAGLQSQKSPAAFSVFTFPLCSWLSPKEFISCKLLVQADKHFILNPLQISDLLLVLLAEKLSNCLHLHNAHLPPSPIAFSVQYPSIRAPTILRIFRLISSCFIMIKLWVVKSL